MKKRILYISYTGMLESLGASQVLNYLYGLSTDYDFHIISLEKESDFLKTSNKNELKKELQKKGIEWYPILYKNGVRGYISNFYKAYKLAKEIIFSNAISLIHCRSYIPATIAYYIKKNNNKIQYLFDTRGFWFDEKVDIGKWKKNGLAYKFAKKFERKLYEKANAIVMLSEKGKEIIENDKLFVGGSRLKNIYFIPTCTNLDIFRPYDQYSDSYEKITIGYVGTTTGWYDFPKTTELLREIKKQMDFYLIIYNKGEHAFIREELQKCGFSENEYLLSQIPFSEMPNKISQFDLSVFFIHPFFSKNASAATKLGELMASGIPILTNKDVGDHEYLIEKYNTGKILDINNLKSYNYLSMIEELKKKEIRLNCRVLAEDVFSLDKGTEKYRTIYKTLIL